MRENLKSVLLVFIGVIVGIILYFQLIEKGNADKNRVNSVVNEKKKFSFDGMREVTNDGGETSWVK